MNAHSDYASIEDNCQKFVKYLAQAITPQASYLETIHLILERLIDTDSSTVCLSSTRNVPSIRIESNYTLTNGGDEMCSPLQSPRTAVFNLQLSLFNILSTGMALMSIAYSVSPSAFDGDIDDCQSDREDYDYLLSEMLEMEVR
jgi:hypothetical protein